MNWLFEAMQKGGPFMWPLLAIAVFAAAISAERMYYILFRANINGTAFFAQMQKLIMANNIDRAIKLCNAAPSAALPKVIKAGLTRANKGEMEIQNAVEEATLEVVPQIMKRTPALQALANIATLLGLLGTIIGLIEAFEALKDATPDTRQQLLSQGIALAMNTTAFGLIVAIPCMVAHLFLSGMTKKIVDEIDQHSVKLENLLVSRGKGGMNPLEK